MKITISTRDPDLRTDMFGSDVISAPIHIEQDVTVIPINREREHSLTPFTPETVEFLVGLGSDIGASLFANWLWSRICKKDVQSLTIERTTIEIITEENIIRTVKERYEQGTTPKESSR